MFGNYFSKIDQTFEEVCMFVCTALTVLVFTVGMVFRMDFYESMSRLEMVIVGIMLFLVFSLPGHLFTVVMWSTTSTESKTRGQVLWKLFSFLVVIGSVICGMYLFVYNVMIINP
jgi:hypothetical protein